MEYQEYKLENTVRKLIKELKANKYLIFGYSEFFPLLRFEIGKESKIPGRYNPLGRIDVGEKLTKKVESFEISLSILGGDDFIEDKKKILSIANKYLEKQPKKRRKKSEHTEYKHHQWHNDGYRPARSSLTKSTPWKWKPKYKCNIDKHKIPPQ